MKLTHRCARCGHHHSDQGRYCRDCHAAYMRDFRRLGSAKERARIHSIVHCETNEEADHLAAAVADLCDELAGVS